MMKGVPRYLVTVLVLALACSLASAYDPSPLQDFCVSTNDSASGVYASFFLYNKLFLLHAVFVNGKFCKDPKLVTANDFFFSRLNIPRDTSNPLGSTVTLLNVDKILGLNTLGISLARIDFAPYGLNPPHIHPRGTEILVVLEGTLLVGFVTSNTDNRLFTKVLNAGDVFVFPIGLIHFQFNSGHTNAVAFAGLSSQNPGVITIANAVFGSNPPINADVLAKAFQLDRNVINFLQKKF
ncbi:germin-like protein subfamily 1 member 11 [Alnus glutinosa]|uniref:germin-like protein subfamily 1 member 11 n=1 Tax=Alnus glutinosa TaxID=3517 RepID=UPI002D796057|nr:germin-like protein subfamily 1 member 11 [Alnus glutinosa]